MPLLIATRALGGTERESRDREGRERERASKTVW